MPIIKSSSASIDEKIKSENASAIVPVEKYKIIKNPKIVTGKTLNNGDLFNVFDLIVPNYIPNLKNIIKILTDLNFEEFHLAGSGPGLFFIIHDLKKLLFRGIKFFLRQN